jgi:prepilin-type N-terminal cleavage/methylation domain-containing protein
MALSFQAKAHRPDGFTLIETMLATTIFALAGTMVFLLLNSGMVLYAENTSVNATHQQARSAVDEMLSNIHASVSIPQLVDTSLNPMPAPGTGPAAGVDFQKFESGPYLLSTTANVSPTQRSVTIVAPNLDANQSLTGLRFSIPTHGIEQDILQITASGNNRTITFANPVGQSIVTMADDSGNGNGNGDGTSNIVGFVTRRASYVVIGSELRYYPTNDPASYKVIARNVTAPTPFQILFNQNGGTDLRSVAAVGLSTAESHYSNRNYGGVDLFINSYIPFRCKLTVYQ